MMGEKEEDNGKEAPLHGNFLINWISEAIMWVTGEKRKKYDEELQATIKDVFKDNKQPCGHTNEYMHGSCGRDKDNMNLIDNDALVVSFNTDTYRYSVVVRDSSRVTIGRLIK